MTTWANNTINKATDSVAGTSANTDATSPQTMADDNSVGTVVWSGPDNAKTSNNVDTGNILEIGETSHYLKATNFGLSIPTGATINGILAEVEQAYKISGPATENSIKIVKGGVISGDDKSTGAETTSTDTYVDYGGATELWGETWTAEDINLSTFGVVYSVKNLEGDAIVPQVDHIRITVYYTTAGTSATWTNGTKNSTSFTNKDKNSTTWTND